MPYYQFNSFTGRIAESTHPQPYYPLSPNRLDRVEPPKPMYATPDMKPVQTASARSGKFFSTVAPEVLKKMQTFQAPNNLPVHIKGGTGDRVLLGLTTAGVVVGLGLCFKMYWELAYRK